MTTQKKPAYKTEKVIKDDGSVIYVGRVSLNNMDTLLEIQDWLLEQYIEADGAIGKIISNEELRAKLTTLCSLLPVVGNGKGEQQFLNFEDICDNWEQLIYLFFNGEINMENREVNNISPSRISQLHFLPYNEMMVKHLKKKREALEIDEKD